MIILKTTYEEGGLIFMELQDVNANVEDEDIMMIMLAFILLSYDNLVSLVGWIVLDLKRSIQASIQEKYASKNMLIMKMHCLLGW